MGDRTTVTLTVRKADLEQNEVLFEGFCDPNTYEADSVQLVDLTYYEVNNANLEIEPELGEKKIPYDKHWSSGDEYSGGEEYFRVQCNGETTLQSFEEGRQCMVELDAVVQAISDSNLNELIQEQQQGRHVMSWKIQEHILQATAIAREELSSSQPEQLDSLVVDMAVELALSKINSTEDEQEQEQLINEAESLASDINNEGAEKQIHFLLDNGYMTHALAATNNAIAHELQSEIQALLPSQTNFKKIQMVDWRLAEGEDIEQEIPLRCVADVALGNQISVYLKDMKGCPVMGLLLEINNNTPAIHLELEKEDTVLHIHKGQDGLVLTPDGSGVENRFFPAEMDELSYFERNSLVVKA